MDGRPRQSLPAGLSQARSNPLLDIGFQDAEGGLVALDGKLQGVQHPLRGIEVGDDSLRDDDRLCGYSDRLGVQPEVDDQLFRRPGNAAKIGVARQCLGVVNLDLKSLLRLPLRLASRLCPSAGIC